MDEKYESDNKDQNINLEDVNDFETEIRNNGEERGIVNDISLEYETEEDAENNTYETTKIETESNEHKTTKVGENMGGPVNNEIPANDRMPVNYGMPENGIPRNAFENNQAEDERLRRIMEQERQRYDRKVEKENIRRQHIKEKKGKAGGGTNIFVKAVALVMSAVVFGTVALGVMYVGGGKFGLIKTNDSDEVSVKQVQTVNSGVIATSGEGAIVKDVSGVVENVMPSIVAITSTQIVQNMGDWYDYFFGNSGDNGYRETTGAGSGIIIGQSDTELLIVTNNHVVEGADSLTINFIDDENVEAYVKGTESNKDLAVVGVKLENIKESTLDTIKIATLGDSDKLKVGEGTIAIGNALGYGQSVTTGVVSALNREVDYETYTMSLIQTDAAINPGNSGGALLNMSGEVIGINSSKYSSEAVEGMGFAIPVSSVRDIIEGLMNSEPMEKVDEEKKGYINIYGRDVTTELSDKYGFPNGVYVLETIEGGAAEKAGINKGDIITEVNGKKVTSMTELSNELDYYEKGEKVTLTIEYLKGNKYKEKEVEVTLGGEME